PASGAEGSTTEDDTIIKNLQEQVQLSEQVGTHLLWTSIATAPTGCVLLHGSFFRPLCQRFECFAFTGDYSLHSTYGLSLLFMLLLVFRQGKAELRTATAKVEEMTKLLQNIQGQMQRRVRLPHVIMMLKAATQEAEAVRREQTVWERKVGQLQARCTALEEEKYEALSKVRESVQIAEEATLQKDQAQLGEKQMMEELQKTMEAIKQLIQDATARTRKEVENARQQCNLQIHRMAEELSALQLECADKEAQIERSLRERKAVEEELEKIYKEGRAEPEYGKMDVLHQRCLNAERSREDMSLKLQSMQNKLKKIEMDYSEELSQCQEEVRRLQGCLNAARDDSVSISYERLKLQKENQRLHREMDELRKATTLTTKQIQFSLKRVIKNVGCTQELGGWPRWKHSLIVENNKRDGSELVQDEADFCCGCCGGFTDGARVQPKGAESQHTVEGAGGEQQQLQC
uniref:Sodium channel and clathrin linker 1 n=1 Tax=Gouania willdenowi TaxID=441366 RepID=A0A8C5D6M4_GOUWI